MDLARNLGRWDAYISLYPEVHRVQSTIAELFAQCINFSVRATAYYGSPWIGKYRYI